MKSMILVILMLFSASSFVPAQKSEYIGYKRKPVLMGKTLPNGVKDLGGGMIIKGNKITSYGIGRFSKGKTQMLWLEFVASENEKGVTSWEVKDALVFPNFTKNQELLFVQSTCTIDDKNDENLVVFADFVQKRKYVVRKAWRTNLKTEKFVSISTRGIKCEYNEP